MIAQAADLSLFKWKCFTAGAIDAIGNAHVIERPAVDVSGIRMPALLIPSITSTQDDLHALVDIGAGTLELRSQCVRARRRNLASDFWPPCGEIGYPHFIAALPETGVTSIAGRTVMFRCR